MDYNKTEENGIDVHTNGTNNEHSLLLENVVSTDTVSKVVSFKVNGEHASENEGKGGRDIEGIYVNAYNCFL